MRPGMQATAIALVVVWAAGAAGTAARQNRPDGPAAPAMSLEAFKALHAAGGALVVDVRSSASYKDGHIPGAISVPLEEIDRRAGEIREAARDRAIVTYCSCPDEHASAAAARTLIARGLARVSALVGGYPAWMAAGGAIER